MDKKIHLNIQLLTSYVHEMTSEEERVQIHNHLKHCTECNQYIELLMQEKTILGECFSIGHMDKGIQEEIRVETLGQLALRKRQNRIYQALALAAILLISLGIMILWRPVSPSQQPFQETPVPWQAFSVEWTMLRDGEQNAYNPGNQL
jgi:hypothetical protein